MIRGILTICLASGLAWSATSRADDSVNQSDLRSQLLQQTNVMKRMMLLRKLHHHMAAPGFAAPGMSAAPLMTAAPRATPPPRRVPASVIQSNSVPATLSDPNDPYGSIVARNVFGLNPIPPPDSQDAQQGPPPPKITLTGIMTIFGPPEALFTVAGVVRDNRPPQDESYIFTEGEAQDDVEVTSIDTNKNVVTFNNHGATQTIPLVDGTASSGSAPSAPSWPGGQNFRMRRFGRNFPGGSPFGGPGGGPGNFQQPSYQPQSYNNGNNSSGFGQSFGGGSSYNNNNNSSSQPALSADDQAAIIAAEKAQMSPDNPILPIMPPTKYDGEAKQAAGLNPP